MQRIVFSALLFLFCGLKGGVIINEVMFNPAGNENYNEFVEIYNNSAQFVDLNNWKIGDQDEIDGVNAYPGSNQGLILKPFSYALILDSSYPVSSTQYAGLIPDSVLLLVIDDGSFGQYGLSNSIADTVFLINGLNQTADSMCYLIDQEQAFSEERLSFTADVWQNSKVYNGTPGKKNSIVPNDYDLSLKLTASAIGRAVNICALIKNCGIKEVSSSRLEIFFKDRVIEQFSTVAIAAGDSLFHTFAVPGQNGSFLLTGLLEVEVDENILNNQDSLVCFNTFSAGSVRLNEFLKKPSTGNCEWLELYNSSNDTISSADLAFRDQTGSLLPLESDLIITPKDYFIVAKDSSIVNMHTIEEKKLLLLKALPSLSDDDALYLCDKTGRVLDSLIYTDNWLEEYDNSIEKINPYLNSADPTNWVPSVRQATPGSQNSVFQEIGSVNGKNSINLISQLVSPNDDGKNDQLLVNYSFDSPYIYLSAEIYNQKGHSIYRILDKAYKPAESSFAWNCRDAGGNLASMGAYILYLEAKDGNNKIHEFKKVFYLVR